MPHRSKNVSTQDPNYAASRPTIAEYLEAGIQVNRTTLDFLKVDVQTGLTFTGIALQTEDSIKRQRNCRSARKAYDTVLKMIKKVDISENDARILYRNLHRLRSELVSLGEVF